MRMNIRRLTILATLIILSTQLFNPPTLTQTMAQTQVRILSHTAFLTSFYYHIVGEVKNEGNVPVADIELRATYYDEANQEIKTETRSTFLKELLAGRKTPFIFYGPTNANRYELVLLQTYTPKPEGKPPVLEIVNPFVDIENNRILGGIRNNGNVNASFIKAVATFYNAERKVASANSDPGLFMSELPPGTTTDFEITFYPPERREIFKWVTISAESTQFAAQQEINGISLNDEKNGSDILTGAVIVIAAIVFIATFLILRNRRKPRPLRKVPVKTRRKQNSQPSRSLTTSILLHSQKRRQCPN